jgi:hypothetical protein
MFEGQLYDYEAMRENGEALPGYGLADAENRITRLEEMRRTWAFEEVDSIIDLDAMLDDIGETVVSLLDAIHEAECFVGIGERK